jgi:hypothetical protein
MHRKCMKNVRGKGRESVSPFPRGPAIMFKGKNQSDKTLNVNAYIPSARANYLILLLYAG